MGGELTIAPAEHGVLTFKQRGAEVRGRTDLEKIVGQAGEDRVLAVFLDGLQDLFISLVSSVDEDARPGRLNAEAFESQ